MPEFEAEQARRAPRSRISPTPAQTRQALKTRCAMCRNRSMKLSHTGVSARAQDARAHLRLPLSSAGRIYGKPIDQYKATTLQARAAGNDRQQFGF
ncbi:MAG: hypothetical protein R2912_01425 [Eubacteriales bacterium]